MGRYVLDVPDVGEGATEAEIVGWHVRPGESVKEDQPIVDLMTDKATFEVTAPTSGKVVSIHGEPGEKVAVASTLIVFEVEGKGNAPEPKAPGEMNPPKAAPGKTDAPKPEPPKPESPKPEIIKPVSAPPPREEPVLVATGNGAKPAFATRAPGERPLASPAVRLKAREAGVLLQFVPGSGPSGRIRMDDLDRYIASGGSVQSPAAAIDGRYREKNGVEEVKVIGLRRVIAERMQEAKRHIPHFAYVEEVDVTELEDTRAHLNETRAKDQPKLTLLPFLMRALVRACPHHPEVNARFDDDKGIVYRHEALHIGIAVQTVGGLMVPVVRHAESRDLWSAAAEVARLAAAAREGKASREELSGSTITITSLGALGGLVTTPIINRPEVAIIGVNKIVEKPVVRNGQIAVRKTMNLSSSFDHRVVDGWTAAEFIQRVKGFLEHPVTLFLE